MNIRTFLLTVILSFGWMVLAPVHVTAQDEQSGECTVSCRCISSGCACSTSGGSGSECQTGGDGCAVAKCGEELLAFYSLDGAVVRLNQPSRYAAEIPESTSLEQATPRLTGGWQFVSNRRAVARHCSGIVVARYFDREEAASIRSRSRVLRI
ncbi:MAG TPA: hypothetical protein VHG28_11520 [Longimicrobiaceae bacterium]|nr:hypothetical protein [Longimicrobiaceae bacterium]